MDAVIDLADIEDAQTRAEAVEHPQAVEAYRSWAHTEYSLCEVTRWEAFLGGWLAAHGQEIGQGQPENLRTEREQLLALVESLSDTYLPVGITAWLSSRNRILGATPAELMEQGRWAELHAAAERLAGGPRNSNPVRVDP